LKHSTRKAKAKCISLITIFVFITPIVYMQHSNAQNATAPENNGITSSLSSPGGGSTGSPPTEIPGEPAGVPGEPAGVPGEPAGVPGEPAGVPGEPAGVPGGMTGAQIPKIVDTIENIPKALEQTYKTLDKESPIPLFIIGIIAVVAIGAGVGSHSKRHHSNSHTSSTAQQLQVQEVNARKDPVYEDIQVITQGGIEEA
jgi:hypothetical protein